MLNKTRCATILILVLSCYSTYAQYGVEGKFLDQDQAPIPFASVLLLHQIDSTMAKGQVSDGEGSFKIDINEAGDYFVSLSAIGYQKKETDVFTLSSASTFRKIIW